MGDMALAGTGQGPAARNIYSLAIVIATASVFGLTYSLTAPLVAHMLMGQGLSETMIGVNAAMHAAGVLAIAPFLSRLTIRFGQKLLIILALLASVALLAVFPLVSLVWLYFPLRFGLGLAAEVLFVLTETWASELSSDANRGRVMATYTASLSAGFAGGPLILSFTGLEGALPFLIGAGLAGTAIVVFLLPGLVQPQNHAHQTPNILRIMCLAPVAMGTTVVNSAVETAGLSFLTLYAVRLGWTETDGARLITVLMVGAILMQLPIGWLADKMDRLRLMLILAGASAVVAFAWPLLLAREWLAYPALFLWGGLFIGIYTVMLAVIGSRFRGPDLVGVYAAMGFFWGGGALVGPMLAGGALDVLHHGLPLFIGGACAAFAVFLLALRGTLRARPAETVP